jgi:rod shape-determining protein MreD
MLATLLAIPVFGFLVVIQTTLVNRMTLLHGTPDIFLLTIIAWALHKRVKTPWHWCIIGGLVYTVASALPFGVSLVGYIAVTGLTLFMRRHTWQVPILIMLVLSFIGTILFQGLSLLGLKLTGNSIPVIDAIGLITLPSVILNLIFAIPVYAIINDMANWLYPEEIEA